VYGGKKLSLTRIVALEDWYWTPAHGRNFADIAAGDDEQPVDLCASHRGFNYHMTSFAFNFHFILIRSYQAQAAALFRT